jgi:hypothetical protein
MPRRPHLFNVKPSRQSQKQKRRPGELAGEARAMGI